jgi:hypothetical protein
MIIAWLNRICFSAIIILIMIIIDFIIIESISFPCWKSSCWCGPPTRSDASAAFTPVSSSAPEHPPLPSSAN